MKCLEINCFCKLNLSWYMSVKWLQIIAAYFSISGKFLPLSVFVQFNFFSITFSFLWKWNFLRHNQGIVVYRIDTTHRARLFAKLRFFQIEKECLGTWILVASCIVPDASTRALGAWGRSSFLREQGEKSFQMLVLSLHLPPCKELNK